eukprot:gnl/MRDRNA2_/MRDRNA2_68194_c0_seq2.p1 gnl/MRDRNA2_/MRDRNA2_68194_c0~~gnl/MRDRNA2_/MRDRNA2_68194_c0_seq2.p1  ORF type:complete len:742 (-),score=130.05 gnl/MRDRNA2_/MRDRNA2_68194_c0_seq2:85-2283(-)
MGYALFLLLQCSVVACRKMKLPIRDSHADSKFGSRTNAFCARGDKLAKSIGSVFHHAKLRRNFELLMNWTSLGKDCEHSKSEVMKKVKEGICFNYGYHNELAGYFLNLFSAKMECLDFLEANEKPRPVTLRVNTLKTRKEKLAKTLLTVRGIEVVSIGAWCKNEGLKVQKTKLKEKFNIPIGATMEYLAGHYMLQSASSFVPVLALNPLQNETVLDMAAAPGGKTTHIGQFMKNTGVLIANELQKPRVASLAANIQRWGLTNTIVTNSDGRDLKSVSLNLDRVLLDAPCSGLGIIAKDPSIKRKRKLNELDAIVQLQTELLLTAVDMVDTNSRTGGYIVYSTCSTSVEENEMVVNSILKLRNVELVPFIEEVPFGRPGFTSFREHTFDPSLRHTQRFLPHVHDMDGFFVAKFKKISNDIPVAHVAGTATQKLQHGDAVKGKQKRKVARMMAAMTVDGEQELHAMEIKGRRKAVKHAAAAAASDALEMHVVDTIKQLIKSAKPIKLGDEGELFKKQQNASIEQAQAMGHSHFLACHHILHSVKGSMRPLSDEETKQVYEKLQKYTGPNLRQLVHRSDGSWLFRLHKQRVYYMSEKVLATAEQIPTDSFMSAGVCLGKFIHGNEFRLQVTALDFLLRLTNYRVWLKPSGERHFTYGNHVVKADLWRISEDVPKNIGVIVMNQNDVPLGFGILAKSMMETRNISAQAIVVYHQADIGQYLRNETALVSTGAEHVV